MGTVGGVGRNPVEIMIESFDQETRNILQTTIMDFGSTSTDVLKEISNFNWLWPVFEAKFCNRDANKCTLRSFSESTNGTASILVPKVLAAHTFFRERFEHTCSGERHLSELLGERSERDLKSRILEGMEESSAADKKVYGLALVIYRLRNNLFHGTKGGSLGLSDQCGNFKYANQTLKVWVCENSLGA